MHQAWLMLRYIVAVMSCGQMPSRDRIGHVEFTVLNHLVTVAATV